MTKAKERPAEVWPVTEAKAHFRELIEKGKRHGPQTITRHGKPVAVLVSSEEWTRRSKRKGNLAEFLAKSPLAGSGLEVNRLGFLSGVSVPHDFDQMGRASGIEEIFDAEVETLANGT